MKETKKGQIDIISFVYVFIGVILIGIMVLYTLNNVVGKMSETLNSTSVEASNRMESIKTTFVSFWDKIIGVAYIINVVMMFVFAYGVVTSPIYALFYIISAIFTLIFAPYAIAPVETIFGLDTFTTEVSQLTITSFLLSKFGVLILGVIVVSGILMYIRAKNGGQYA